MMESLTHEGHRQRLRDRYRENGIDGFSEHELLELLLSYAIARKDTNPLAHRLIERFGNLRGVFEADEADLLQVEGLGEHTSFLLRFMPGLARCYYEQMQGDDLRLIDTERLVRFFAARFIGRQEECLYAAFLDENKRLIQCNLQYVGSINAVEIHINKMLKQAQRCACRYVVIAHNHFVDTNPSVQDVFGTRRIRESLRQYHIELLDHIIICGSSGLSMKESGHLDKAI